MNITSFDKYSLECQLAVPTGEEAVSKLVIYVHGSGPGTCENRDIYEGVEVNMFQTFATELTRNGTAFFMYSQRGVHATNNPPLFYDLDVEEYKSYLPLHIVEDIHYIICALRNMERLKNSKIYLLGASEGTVILPLFAEKYPAEVDAILLWGYANKNLKDTMIWQLSGESFTLIFQKFFELDGAGRISRSAFDQGKKDAFLLTLGLGDNAFELCDTNQDGYIDFAEMTALGKSLIGVTANDFLNAAEAGNDEWLLNSGMTAMTSGWLLQHAGLRSNMDVLPKLELPIHIFHGALDMNCSVQGVYDINQQFQACKKTNLTINVFPGADHSLNLPAYVASGEMSEGIKAIFDTIRNIS